MLCDVSKCTGCGSCQNICPKKCIVVDMDEKGYLVPKIDEEACVNCNLCEKACPILNEVERSNRIFPETYLAHSLDNNILENSASGGIATVLNKYYTENLNGYACGVVYNKFIATFEMFDKNADTSVYGHSKYVQSHTNDVFFKVKQKLEEDKPVFFCGLPCQVAGLHAYLGKEYDNLLTADIVCHGTSSSKLFLRYVEYMEKKINKKIRNICHTSKKDGWSIMIQRTICIETEDGEKIYISSAKDSYLFCFLSNLFFKPACYECKYAKMPRIGDLTLGDFFGIGTIRPAHKLNSMGESMVMVNTDKGQSALEQIKDKIYCKKREIEEALYYNHNLWKPSKKHKNYDAFDADVLNCSYEELSDKYYNENYFSIVNRKIRALLKKILGYRMVTKCILYVNKKNGTTKKVDSLIEEIRSEIVEK